MGVAVEELEITTPNGVFRARAAGPAHGRLVLLLHGFPQTSASWASQLTALGDAGHRAVAFDQRGYSPGARPVHDGAYARDALVADVLDVADALGAEVFDLAGHDWGGAVAWQVAGLHPGRLRTLTVVSTPHPAAFGRALADPAADQRRRSAYIDLFRAPAGTAEQVMLADDAASLRAAYAGLPEESVREYLAVLTAPGALTAALNWYRQTDLTTTEGLADITTPALYVWSDDDIALGRDAAELTGEYVRGPYTFAALAGVDHWIPEKAAAELNTRLLAHLSAH